MVHGEVHARRVPQRDNLEARAWARGWAGGKLAVPLHTHDPALKRWVTACGDSGDMSHGPGARQAFARLFGV